MKAIALAIAAIGLPMLARAQIGQTYEQISAKYDPGISNDVTLISDRQHHLLFFASFSYPKGVAGDWAVPGKTWVIYCTFDKDGKCWRISYARDGDKPLSADDIKKLLDENTDGGKFVWNYKPTLYTFPEDHSLDSREWQTVGDHQKQPYLDAVCDLYSDPGNRYLGPFGPNVLEITWHAPDTPIPHSTPTPDSGSLE